MSPEALARLRESLALDDVDTGDFWLRDLRALLDAYDRETQGGVPFVSREEDYRRGIAAERARVVALVRSEAKRLRAEMGLPTEGDGLRGDSLWQLADRIEEGT